MSSCAALRAFAVVASLRVGSPLWRLLAVLAALGGALAAAYFLRLLYRLTHGRPTEPVLHLSPARLAPAELVAWAPLVILALALGLLPALVLNLSADVSRALEQVSL